MKKKKEKEKREKEKKFLEVLSSLLTMGGAASAEQSAESLPDIAGAEDRWEETCERGGKEGDFELLRAAARRQYFDANLQRKNARYGRMKAYGEGWGASEGPGILNIRNVEEGDSIAHIAARYGYFSDLASTLEELGVNLHLMNVKGMTAWEVADVLQECEEEKMRLRESLTPDTGEPPEIEIEMASNLQ